MSVIFMDGNMCHLVNVHNSIVQSININSTNGSIIIYLNAGKYWPVTMKLLLAHMSFD